MLIVIFKAFSLSWALEEVFILTIIQQISLFSTAVPFDSYVGPEDIKPSTYTEQ